MLRGEVWWVNFDPSVGSEVQKQRPAVIISNNVANKNLERVVVVPLTSNVKRVYPAEALVTINQIPAKAMTDQIMTADKARLKNKMGSLSDLDLIAVENAIQTHLALCHH